MALAAEVSASQPGRRAWVGVAPSNSSSETYVVLHFELEAEDLAKIRAGDDVDAYWIDHERMVAASMDELCTILRRWLEDLNVLVQPVFCEYPA
jgi:hypothetical protein